jgi:hypothetical protein
MISLTEEFILNQDFAKQFPSLRRFRIEYGFECSCPEGTIYLPSDCDPDQVEKCLQSKINFKCQCYPDNENKP